MPASARVQVWSLRVFRMVTLLRRPRSLGRAAALPSHDGEELSHAPVSQNTEIT
jgi:hypothetical protein